jgi:hypothetical protein
MNSAETRAPRGSASVGGSLRETAESLQSHFSDRVFCTGRDAAPVSAVSLHPGATPHTLADPFVFLCSAPVSAVSAVSPREGVGWSEEAPSARIFCPPSPRGRKKTAEEVFRGAEHQAAPVPLDAMKPPSAARTSSNRPATGRPLVLQPESDMPAPVTFTEPVALERAAGAAFVVVARCSLACGRRFLSRTSDPHNWRLRVTASGERLTAEDARKELIASREAITE